MSRDRAPPTGWTGGIFISLQQRTAQCSSVSSPGPLGTFFAFDVLASFISFFQIERCSDEYLGIKS
jgi:hypothetical protein